MGAVWKFSNSEQTVPALSAIPHGMWLSLSALELLCSLGLLLPALNKSLTVLVPIAALCIALEMVGFSVLDLSSRESNHGPMFYWLVVAALCAFIAYGRLALKPL